MADEIIFKVFGKPIPEGSTKAYPIRRKNGSIGVSITHVQGNSLLEWRHSIAEAYVRMGGQFHDKPVAMGLEAEFYFMKPVSAPKKRVFMTFTPDADKVLRAVSDALTNVAYADDSQLISVKATKRYCQPGEEERTVITVRVIGTPDEI